MDTPVLARMTTPVTGSPFERAPGIARAFPMVAFPEAGEADSGPPSRRRLDHPAPVAGRLALHAAAWRDITDSAFVLQAVQGYLLDFHTTPPIMSARQTNVMETTMNSGKAELLDARGDGTSSKGGHREMQQGTGFYSRMFLVPKKGGKSRPIINLKPLNRYVRTPHFITTTLKDVSQLIQPGDWAVCLDLRDAYFHVPVHTRHGRFLQFIWKGHTYRYTALPFGLSTSPFCFTKVTKPIVQYLRSQSVRVVFYLDDVLLLAQTRRGAQENRRRVVHLLGKLGFSLNHEKSDFVPRQSFSYLVLQWDTRSMQVRLPEDKVAEIHSLAANLQDRRVVSARSLMTFLGKVTFASYGVELARLHSRELQTALRTVYKRPRDICRTVHLHREALHSLDFWKELTPSPLPLRRPEAEIIMATDASSSGWGGSLHALSASGRWSRDQRSRHINSLELMAVENSLRSFEDRVKGRTVCVQINNRTQWPTWRRKNSVAYLAKEELSGLPGEGRTQWPTWRRKGAQSRYFCPARLAESCCGANGIG